MAICPDCEHEYLDSYERCPFCERRAHAHAQEEHVPVPVGRDRRAAPPAVLVALVAAIGASIGFLAYLGVTGVLATQVGAAEAAAARQSCLLNETLVEGAVVRYTAEHDGRPPRTLDALVGDYLDAPPECPGDGAYTWDTRRERLICSMHGWHGDR